MHRPVLEPTAASEIPRRRFLLGSFTLAAGSCLWPSLLSGCQATPVVPVQTSSSADAMDEALEMMAKLGPLSNHGPMAAEALVSLGQAGSVVPFVEAYKKRFTRSYPAPREAVTRDNWRSALGEGERNADWSVFFNRELNEARWQEVVKQWSATLAPGLAAAAAHGLIRTAHAVRSLSTGETALRLHELAEGLGYWAAYYQTLPEAPADHSAQLKPAQAIERIPLLPEEQRARGSIMAGLQSLKGFSPFGKVANLVPTSGKAELALSELTETFATVYLRNVSPRSFVTLLHSVTGLTAIRSLLPYVSEQTAQRLLHYGWQLGAGLYSIAGVGAGNTSAGYQERKIRRFD